MNHFSIPRIDRRQGLFLGLVLLAALALILSVASPSSAANNAPARPRAQVEPQQAAAFNRLLQGSQPKATAVTISGRCLRDIAEPPLSGVNCTANDVQLAQAGAITILDPPGCEFPGDTVTFKSNFQLQANATNRYDIGIYFASGGQSNALTGQCQVTTLDIPPATDLELTNQSGKTCGGILQGRVCKNNGDCTIANSGFTTCNDVGPAKDTCGDLQGNFTQEITLTVSCVDPDNDGTLNLPYCTAWSNQSGDLCRWPTQAIPDTPSKCNCNNGFEIPIDVPPIKMQIEKTPKTVTAKPGDEIKYTLKYTNLGDIDPALGTATASPITVTDTLPPQLRLVSYSINGGVGTCTPSPSGYGATITCSGLAALPETNPPSFNTIELTVQVDPAAKAVQTTQNKACVAGFKQQAPTLPPGTDCDETSVTTPVTLAVFSASATGNGTTRYSWSTATETANAGFNLYVRTAGGYRLLNDQLILSRVVDSTTPTDYSVEIAGVPEGELYIEDVALSGEVRSHGPFTLGVPYGERVETDPIDWAAIRAENAALETARAGQARAAAADKNRGPTKEAALAANPVELRVKQDGIYRVTYEQIMAATGVDLAGVAGNKLALTNRGVPVPIYVSARTFGPGAYIEFIGQGLDTLYTDTNVYRLEVNGSLAASVGVSRASLPRNPVFAPYYMETVIIENNKQYSPMSPTGDPWYDTLVYVNKPMEFPFTLNVNNLVSNAAPASVLANLWGLADLITGPDHHVQVAVNGVQAADKWFDANETLEIAAPLPNGTLVNGANTLTITAPFDNGAAYDIFALESFGVTYPRAFVAANNRLAFKAAGQAFRVTSLSQSDVVAYRLENGLPVRLGNITVKAEGAGFTASFAGSNEAQYYVATTGGLLTPEIRNAAPLTDITSGTADLLIITHPNFLSGFGPMVAARQAQGYSVKLVNVEDVYARYSGGIFDALAIRDYIHHAIKNMGVKYIILGGGDTQDYRDYLLKGSISFIPSVYAQTTKDVLMAPVDPLYTDIDGDRVPNVTIGRFPVRTTAELQMMVNKTLAYGSNPNGNTLVLAADNGFEGDSELFAGPLNFGQALWNMSRAYIGPLGTTTARSILLNEMNKGPRLVSFVGHSGMTQWTTDRTSPLFTSADAAALTNANPMVVTQWGCWNTYYIHPSYNSLGHRFLLSGNNGAAAITGSTTITNSGAEQALGKILMPLITEKGMPIGAAMQTAKSQLALSNPEMVDVLLGWTILGDPTLVIQP